MIASIDISRKRGDTRRHIFAITDSGSAVDISGWTEFVLAVNSDSEPIDLENQLGTINGELTTDGTDGRVHFIPPEDWPVESYFYDAQALDSNGERITFVQGRYSITQDIAKG